MFKSIMFRKGVYFAVLAFLVSGLAAVGMAAYCRISLSALDPLLKGMMVCSAPAFLLLSGLCVLITSTAAYYDLLYNDHLELFSFKAAVGAMIFTELVLVVGLTLVAEETSEVNELSNSLNRSLHHYSTNNSTPQSWKQEISTSWDILQDEYHCCGLSGPSDWASTGLPVPLSCCGGDLPPAQWCHGCLEPLANSIWRLVKAGTALALFSLVVISVALFSIAPCSNCSQTFDLL